MGRRIDHDHPTFADLLCLDTQAQNNKARGFVETQQDQGPQALSTPRSNATCAASPAFPSACARGGHAGRLGPPTNFDANASFKGVGKFLIKLGGLPASP